ncbi:MAG TPA: hypothetical protein H9810_08830, partial [Candidatus Gemmiger excrementavium]|nr:hypothetical protein [Candidatus Gemmiger excrementavium]
SQSIIPIVLFYLLIRNRLRFQSVPNGHGNNLPVLNFENVALVFFDGESASLPSRTEMSLCVFSIAKDTIPSVRYVFPDNPDTR